MSGQLAITQCGDGTHRGRLAVSRWLRGAGAGRRALSGAVLLATLTTLTAASACADDTFGPLADAYQKEIRPLVQKFCFECHSADEQEGEIDLERFAALVDVRRSPRTWQKVAEKLASGEMPPKEAQQQPTPHEREMLAGWVHRYLTAEAQAAAGDPGRVVLRRLSNAEYTNTIRDLTGVPLEPAREFPVDGAAGEGFTNVGESLVMSPALLTKYLDAGKEIAAHAVLVPDGFHFSAATTRSDWTNDALARIRAIYREHADAGGASQVNLQGIVFDTNDGGRLPVEKYLAATMAEREALRAGTKSVAAVATAHGLNAKYLGILWTAMNDQAPSLLLDGVRARWRVADADGAVPLAAEIGTWQKALWRFTSVGHIGKVGGPKAWQEPVTPLAAAQPVRLKLSTTAGQKEVTLYLVAGDAGDGNANDFVVWQQPRLVAPGRPDLLLRDVRDFTREMTARRQRLIGSTARALDAAAEVARASEKVDIAALASRHGVDRETLDAWLDYLGLGQSESLKLDHFTGKLSSTANYDFVKGWGSAETPSLVANSSDSHVRIPGNIKARGVCVHPSPTLQVAVGWRSPIAGAVRIEGKVTHAHPECGNGVTWSLELRRGATRQRLAGGTAQGAAAAAIGPVESGAVQPGDLVSVLVGPRDGNHACDLTDLELVLTSVGEDSKAGAPAAERQWSLTQDVASDVLAGNPHADRFGNEGVWHFYTEPVSGGEGGPVVPAGSLLARWQAAKDPAERHALAVALEELLARGPAAGGDEKNPDAVLYRQVASLGGPLFVRAWPNVAAELRSHANAAVDSPHDVGLDPAMFGKHPNGSAIDAASLCVQATSVIEVRLPADLAAGAELVTTGALHAPTGAEGSVQLQASTSPPAKPDALRPDLPVIANDGSTARKRFERAFDDFRQLFPAALCYTKIVPVDEVVTLTLFHREDEHLRRLMLDDAQTAQLDQLWDELHFASQDALKLVDAFLQLLEYASQDADPKVFEPMRQPINDRAAAFRQALVAAEPKHVDALVAFAARAYRRPLAPEEDGQLRALYRKLREEELSHEEAFRLVLARLFVSPEFLYRIERPRAGAEPQPVSDFELANRLSYFLWATMPDDELARVAAAGRLGEPETLVGQARRMLAGERVRNLAVEFACQWLDIRDFDKLDEKSERHFPTFAELRGAMYEESVRFFADLFQRDRSVLEILDADHTFVNEALAKHYGIPGVAGPEWRRVDGVRQHARGGILGMSTTVAKHSGASRTSPILRGNWLLETVLGEKLPKPPKGVPPLPDDEAATDGLTVRQLVEKHRSVAQCAVCHQRMDPFGFALEAFDAIGQLRDKDLGDRPIDTSVTLPDGAQITGIAGLRDYLLRQRKDQFVRQFCRKLLGYALGRAVQLSDEPLMDEMMDQLRRNDYRVSAAVETIVRSKPFRFHRATTEVEEP